MKKRRKNRSHDKSIELPSLLDLPYAWQRTVGIIARNLMASLVPIGNGYHHRYRVKLIESEIVERFEDVPIHLVRRNDLMREKNRLFRRSPHRGGFILAMWAKMFDAARTALWLSDEQIPDLTRLPPPPKEKSHKRTRVEKTAEQTLTPHELTKIMSVAEGEDRLVMILGFGLALRQQDMRGAHRRAIRLDHSNHRGTFSVEFVVDCNDVLTTVAKTPNAPRPVHFGRAVYDELVVLLAGHDDPDAFLLGDGKKFIGRNALNSRFQALCIKAGVTREVVTKSGRKTVARCSFRMARRIGTTIWIDAGTPVGKVKARMGHAHEHMSVNVYYVKTFKTGETRPLPTIVPQKGRSFYATARSASLEAVPHRARTKPNSRPSDKMVSRAARCAANPNSIHT